MTLELSTTTIGGAPTPHQRRLSDKALDLIGSHLSPNTRRAYTSDLAQVFQWLVDTDRARPIDLELDKAQELAAYSTLTATSDPQVIVEYIADQAGTLKPSTIARRVAALAKLHASATATSGRSNGRPTRDPAVGQALTGARRRYAQSLSDDPTARPTKGAEPMLLSDLEAIVGPINPTARGLRDTALMLVGLHGAFRRSELVALNVEDITRYEWGVRLLVRVSKTDQLAEGRHVDINTSGGPWCPVGALAAWLRLAQINEGPIFREITRGGVVTPHRLGGHAVSRIIKARAEAVGMGDRGFTAHSLRSGLVTQHRRNGVPLEDIAQVTGHRSYATLKGYDKGISPNTRAPRLVAG